MYQLETFTPKRILKSPNIPNISNKFLPQCKNKGTERSEEENKANTKTNTGEEECQAHMEASILITSSGHFNKL